MPLPGPPLLPYPAPIPLDEKPYYSGKHRLDHARNRCRGERAVAAPNPHDLEILTKPRHSPSRTTARPE